jgi:superfamily I DNA/RNA helicase
MAGLVPRGISGRSLIPDTPETWRDLSLDLDIDPILETPARQVLTKSCQLAMQGTIDYDDQIYISTLLFGAYERYDLVFVDEAQDLSPLNHLQVKNAAKSQVVAVGDSHQAIYAWRGADSNSMRNLRGLRETWTDLTLSITFRCPRSVVQRQQSYVPLFTAGPNNLPGHIERLTSWRPTGGADAAILCRNNAPLIRLAFRCLRAQIPVNYLGRDIGANLKRLYNKLSNHGKSTLETTIANAWAEAKQNPDKLDKYESLVAVLESSDSIDSAMRFLTEARTNSITLATGHKAKGMEWPTVYHLNTYLIPSKWVHAMEDGEHKVAALQQENNLRYVIETRTKDRLLFVDSTNLELTQ